MTVLNSKPAFNLREALTSLKRKIGLKGAELMAAKTVDDVYNIIGTNRNKIINGAMVIDQRNAGASVTVNTDPIYTIDRFFGYIGGGLGSYTAQQSTTAPSNFKNSLLITAGAGASITSGVYAGIAQKIEGLNIVDFGFGTSSAKSVSISFWIRCSLTGTFGGYVRNGDTADRSYIFAFTINSANTWEYKTVVIPGDTTGTWATNTSAGLQVGFDLGVGTNYSADAGSWVSGNRFGLTGGVKLLATTGATMYITGLQVEVGTQATPFERRAYSTEFQLCTRYYWKNSASGVYSQLGFFGTAGSTTAVIGYPILPSVMRATPTLNSSNTRLADGASGLTFSSVAVTFGGTLTPELTFTVSGATTYRPYYLQANNNASAWFDYSAEL